MSHRHHLTASPVCYDCKQGHVIPRWTFCTFWVERFTPEEIEEMAEAMWG